MKYDPFSRRMFLQGSGGFLFSVPFLSSLLPRKCWGQNVTAPLRYIGVVADLGYGQHIDWYPTNNPLERILSVPGHHQIRYAPLRGFAPNSTSNLSPIFKNHLNRHFGKMLMLRGLDIPSVYGHNKAACYGNLADSLNNAVMGLPQMPTIDYVINQSRTFNPGRKDSVIMGYTNPIGTDRIAFSWQRDGSGRVTPKLWDGTPLDMFKTIFPNPSIYDSGTGTPAPQPNKPYVDHLSLVFSDYQRVAQSRQISSVDKVVLENALDRFRDVQRSLGEIPTVTGAACKPNQTRYDQRFPRNTVQDEITTMKAYVDLAVAAVACDAIRVLTIGSMWDSRRSASTKIQFSIPPGGNYHGNVTHEPFSSTNGVSNIEIMRQYNEFHVMAILKPLLDQLEDALDVDGKPLLDNSLVHFTMESALVHDHMSVPTVLAGKAGGKLRTGWYIDYMNRSKRAESGSAGGHSADPENPRFTHHWPGLVYNRLFSTIFSALGLQANEFVHPIQSPFIGINGGYGYVAKNLNQNVSQYLNTYAAEPLPLPTSDG